MKTDPGTPLSTLRAAVSVHLELFLVALGFLTRLGPVRVVPSSSLAKSLLYFAPVGAIIGAIIAAPLYLGLFSGQPLAAALVVAVLHAWLTRALHHDGIADLFDALGSGKRGEEFWMVMKDSRVGAFGCLALVFTVFGHIVLTAACLRSHSIAVVAFFPIFGRCLPAILIYSAGKNAKAPGLGAIFTALERKEIYAGAALFVLVTVGLLLIGWAALLVGMLLSTAFLSFLVRLGKREGRINGDFLGALIIVGELSILAGVAATATL